MTFRIALFCMFLPSATTLAAQQRAAVSVDSAVVETGEAVNIYLLCSNQPSLVDLSSWNDIVPTENRIKQSAWINESGQWRQTISCIFFDSAMVQLPPVAFHFPDGSTLISNTLSLSVLPTPIKSTDIIDLADNKDIWLEPRWWRDFMWIGWILAGGVLLIWMIRQWRQAQKAVGGVRRLSPEEIALQKLRHLEDQNYPAQGKIALFYDQLSHTVREYLQKKYGVEALTLTTQETLLAIAENENFPTQIHEQLRELLDQSDRVKFAKAPPPVAYHKSAIQFAIDWVQSAPKAKPPEE